MSAATFHPDTWIRHGAALAGAWRLVPPADIRRGPAGSHLLNTTGASLDFHDYRAYQPGDDLRQVDWGVYARSDALVIRQYREEISPVLEIFLDTSASMGMYAGKCAGAIFASSFLVGLARAAEGRPVVVAGGRRFSGHECEHGLVAETFSGGADVTGMAGWCRAAGKPVRCVISDFLVTADMDALLTPLRRDAAATVLIQILCASEREPAYTGGVRFRDVEDPAQARDLRIDAAAIQRYRERLDRHFALIDDTCRRLDIRAVRLDVADGEESPEAVAPALTRAFRDAGLIEVA